MAITPEQTKWLNKVASRQNLTDFAREDIAKQIESGALIVNSKPDLKRFVKSLRASGADHLFAGPSKADLEKQQTENPFDYATFNATKQAQLFRVNPSLAKSLAEKAGGFIGMTEKQARDIAARRHAS